VGSQRKGTDVDSTRIKRPDAVPLLASHVSPTTWLTKRSQLIYDLVAQMDKALGTPCWDTRFLDALK